MRRLASLTLDAVSRTIGIAALTIGVAASAQTPQEAAPAPPGYDAALADKVGADERGMRPFVLVILKTGPHKIPAGPERDEMFKGHFDNMKRLAAEGKLVTAGPLDGVDGWRGLFIIAAASIDEARQHVGTDPVIVKGEMVAEYHRYYGSAALMLMGELHDKVSKKRF